jgi:LPS-assembly lipoprotein
MRQGVAIAFLLFCATELLTGCGMKPLYGTSSAGTSAVEQLSSISIPPADTRVGQIIRNDLLSAIRPAGSGSADRYKLELVLETREDKVAKLNDLGADRRNVTVKVTYRLITNSNGTIADNGRTFSQVSYDETGQSFADLRARDNAYERAAHEISTDLKSRLAAHFAAS